jgi:glycosyltransferase involved in cell wall biosynthesis
LWINAIANRMPTASTKDARRIIKKLRGFTQPIREVEPNIFVLNPLAFPSYGNEVIRRFNQAFLVRQTRRAMRSLRMERPFAMVFNPAAGLVAGKLGEDGLIYYCVDEYTAFTGASKGLKEIEQDLLSRSDLVIVSAEKLIESKRPYNKNTFLIRHGTDWKHFRQALSEDLEVPGDIETLPRPIIGFHGLLADWVDYELLKKVATHFRNGSVVLIGKVAVDAEKKIRVLDGVDNIHLLGPKPYSDLPSYCKGFDVALNPFEINELTLAANPLKVREYLSAGLPVVSTDIPEVRILEYCFVSRSHDEFIKNIETALEEPKSSRKISDSVKGESWDTKVDELRRVIYDFKSVMQAF